MSGMGECTFVGYVAQKANGILQVFVPENIPNHDHERVASDGVYLKAMLNDRTFIGGAGEDSLEGGRMIFGEGRVRIAEDGLPEVFLRTLLVFGRKAEGIEIPEFLMEKFLADVGVSSHPRKLPRGMKASKRQRLLAAKKGIYLPKGYTYVSEHIRKQEKTQRRKS